MSEQWVPSSAQLLLLRAALGSGDEALAAWQEWEDEHGLDAPEEGSYRLLPLVYRNLVSSGYTGRNTNRLRGIHRRAWAGNQSLFGHVRPVIERLRSKNIPVLLLKGTALACSYYPDSGCRPMRDVDILVPLEEATAVCCMLETDGWKSLHWRPQVLKPSYFKFRHAIDFEHSSGGRIDAHWHALNICTNPKLDDLFWEHSQSADFAGIPVSTCQATEHLLEICVHGIAYSPVPPVRWIADALLLLRSGEPIDWQRLVRAALDFDLVPYTRAALRFLKTTFDAPIPIERLRELEQCSPNSAVAAEYRRDVAPFEPRTALDDLLALLARWRRSSSRRPLLRLPSAARYLQYAFELESLWTLVPQLARSAVRRLTHPITDVRTGS